MNSIARARAHALAGAWPELDAAALAAVRRWKFEPATVDGQPRRVWVEMPLKFSLH